jgi:hypothetical protein
MLETNHEQGKGNIAKGELRELLELYFNSRRVKTDHGEFYDFNGGECEDMICRAAATLVFLSHPSEDSELHLFPENCDENRQRLLYNIFHRTPVSTESIRFVESDVIGDHMVLIEGGLSPNFKQERIEKMGLEDLVLVIDDSGVM